SLRPSGPLHLCPGAQPIGATVRLSIEGLRTGPEIVLTDRRREVTWRIATAPTGDHSWSAQALMPSEPTLIHYFFQMPDGGILRERIQYEGRNAPAYGEWLDRNFQIAVYDPAHAPAEWTWGQVIYQVFPDRFARSDGYYGAKHGKKILDWGALPDHPPRGRDFSGGNLLGLIEKLDYLADLSVECLYLTPIFTSPTNHRYDAINYHEIDPLLGTEEQFVTFVEEAHRRGIRVILDAVFNHCSDSSIYFRDAQRSRQSPYYSWFTFTRWPDQYEAWLGFRHMPEFTESPEVERFLIGPEGVTAHWLRHKIDGFRTDVTPWVTTGFWRRFRRAVRALNPEAYLVAEEWQDASDYLIGDTFDATMNYRFAWALHGFLAHDKLTASEFDDRLQLWRRDTPPPWQLAQMNLVDSHDTGRILTTCGGDKRRVKQMAAFQFAYVGAPMIYYGDEAGIEGDYAESGRRAFPWENIDADLRDFYRRALDQRKKLPALRTGSVETVVIDDLRRVYVFARRLDVQSVYAAFNAGDAPATVTIPLLPGESGRWVDSLGGQDSVDARDGTIMVTLDARRSAWWAPG
ncbi:MAG TPA: glycoside hydrolase family 13 protein, partial [Aggregatilineales bacterium]|nr:glycoside hydrolase family 13 protein [Aggregatilineales bacterium]